MRFQPVVLDADVDGIDALGQTAATYDGQQTRTALRVTAVSGCSEVLPAPV